MPAESKNGETEIRPASAAEAAALVALVRGERLNPTGLDWRNFVVACRGGSVIGAGQLRPRGPGVRELGSLVVRRDCRGQGIAALLVDALVGRADGGRLLVIVPRRAEPRYRRWGFRRCSPHHAPWRVALGYAIGQAASVEAVLRGRRPRRLVILEREVGR